MEKPIFHNNQGKEFKIPDKGLCIPQNYWFCGQLLNKSAFHGIAGTTDRFQLQ